MPTNADATGFWSNQKTNNARQGRALLQALFPNNDANVLGGVRSGVIATTGLAGVNDLLPFIVSGMTIAVGQGMGVAHRSGEGPYLGWLINQVNVTLDPPPASNPRNDIVAMRFYDSVKGDVSPSGQPCRIEAFTGAPGAVPVDPITANTLGVYTSFPTSGGGIGIPIGRAQVSTGGVITMTDLRRGVSLLGGPLYFMPGDNPATAAVRSGELAWNPTTGILSVSDTGGVRRSIRYGSDIGGEWRASATQTLGVGSTKLTFPTATQAPNGLTFNGSDTWTVQTSGVYSLWSQLRSSANVNGGVVFGATTYADATHVLPFTGFTGGPDYGIGGSSFLTAGQQFCVYFYNNNTSTVTNFALRPAQVKIWKQQAAA